MIGAYLAVGFAAASVPRALWSGNPVTISFSGSQGTASSGSIGDSFKCAPNVSGVSLKTSVIPPGRVSLTTNFSGGGNCGPPFTTVTITAHCRVSNCRGTYTGTVTVIKGYTTYTPSLTVNINVS